jgi:methylglutaconyl-CoA hydratase
MVYRTLKIQLDARGVLFVSLNRPEVRNAFNEDVIVEFTQVFTEEVQKKEVKIIVLKGEGPVFCAGGDLNWMKNSVNFSYEENLSDTQALSSMFALMNECPKPLIGLIHGAAIGGGVGLVSVCDVVIATAQTQFSLSEVRLGIVPACIGPFVIAKIGHSHARRFFMSAERFLGSTAKSVGLVHEVVTHDAELNPALEGFLSQMLECSPQALAAAKRLILELSWPERRAQLADYLDYISRTLADLRVSPEGQEGLRAFLEKRKPNWMAK